MAGIKHAYQMKQKQERQAKAKKPLTDNDVRRIFYDELLSQGGLNQKSIPTGSTDVVAVVEINKQIEGWDKCRKQITQPNIKRIASEENVRFSV